MATERILIVDDEETLCEVLQLNLENEGYDVDIAFSAEQALTYDLKQYSLILLDIMLPKLAGGGCHISSVYTAHHNDRISTMKFQARVAMMGALAIGQHLLNLTAEQKEEAYRFLDYMAEGGFRWWQVLPFCFRAASRRVFRREASRLRSRCRSRNLPCRPWPMRFRLR